MTGPRKLLAAAALTMTAACSTGRAPAARSASFPAPVTSAATTTTPAPAPAPIADLVLMPAVEVIAVTAPVAEAAAPRCDENGRPLAGNVRTKNQSSMDDCS